MTHDKLYDRLPLPMAQVLRDVAIWRAHVLNNRDQSAEDTLIHLAESADELDRWEGEQEHTARVTFDSETHRVFSQSKRFTDGIRPKLRLVLVDDPED